MNSLLENFGRQPSLKTDRTDKTGEEKKDEIEYEESVSLSSDLHSSNDEEYLLSVFEMLDEDLQELD